MPARHPLPRWTVWGVAFAVLVIAGGVLAVLWWWVDGQRWTDPAHKTTALLDVVKVASGVAVGGGGLFALYLAARRQRTQELELAHTEADATARRVTDLYATAVEQLGSDKAPVRLGGLYALERLAQDAPDQRQTIVNVLCAYLRMPFDPPDNTVPKDDRTAEHLAAVQEREVRVTAQRILAAHQRPSGPSHWPNLHLDLSGATLVDTNFSDCHLHEAKFTGTVFTGNSTRFFRTTFTGIASFTGAVFRTETAFNEAVVAGEVWFNVATFADYAAFDGLRVARFVSFENAWVVSSDHTDISRWPDGWRAHPISAERQGLPGRWRKIQRIPVG
jgi:hypothetical protein